MRSTAALSAVAVTLASAAGAAAQSPGCDQAGWERVIAAHVDRYPLLGVEDAYKLLHQGVFGTGHAAPTLAAARLLLEHELRALDPGKGASEPVAEAISPAGMVRVHLRPYLAAGGDPEPLLVAFVETAGLVAGGADELRCAAEVVERTVGDRWPMGVWRAFMDRMVEAGLPATHHSEAFVSAYGPAYRVVSADLLRIDGPSGR
jgi:hypothetical protein